MTNISQFSKPVKNAIASNLVATLDGYYFEIQQQSLLYIGPEPLENEALLAFENYQILLEWFLRSWTYPEHDSYSADDRLALDFAHLIKADCAIAQEAKARARTLSAA
jgi:hypothetical protein